VENAKEEMADMRLMGFWEVEGICAGTRGSEEVGRPVVDGLLLSLRVVAALRE
jgi:hypothetical protein